MQALKTNDDNKNRMRRNHATGLWGEQVQVPVPVPVPVRVRVPVPVLVPVLALVNMHYDGCPRIVRTPLALRHPRHSGKLVLSCRKPRQTCSTRRCRSVAMIPAESIDGVAAAAACCRAVITVLCDGDGRPTQWQCLLQQAWQQRAPPLHCSPPLRIFLKRLSFSLRLMNMMMTMAIAMASM